MILQLSILALLLYCTHSDLKTRTVGNIPIGLVALLSIPLIYSNRHNISIVHTVAALGILAAFFIRREGGADIKAILSLIFTLNIIGFFIFFSITSIGYFVLLRACRGKPPGFVAIVAGYFFSLL